MRSLQGVMLPTLVLYRNFWMCLLLMFLLGGPQQISQGFPITRIYAPKAAAAAATATRLFVSTGNGGGDSSSPSSQRQIIMARNNARTCVKSFLTQRAIQSFMFLLEECRDPHSGKWVEDFLGLSNLLEYHGTGAFDIDRFPIWEMVLLEMMEMPKGMSTCKSVVWYPCVFCVVSCRQVDNQNRSYLTFDLNSCGFSSIISLTGFRHS